MTEDPKPDIKALRVVNQTGHPFERATTGSIGFDLRSNAGMKRCMYPGQRWTFDTGIAVELPEGHGALVQPRSGLARDHGVYAITGVIDNDYRGVIKVTLVNAGQQPYEILPGDRIAQLVVIPVASVAVVEVASLNDLSSTTRSDHGFGSTGR